VDTAQAVNLYARPRMTVDVDVTVEWPRSDLETLMKKARANGFDLLVDDPKAFLKATSVLPFAHRRTGMPVDVVLASSGLERDLLDGAVSVRIGTFRVPVIAPEGLVVTKLLAGRAKDVEDAESVLREQRAAIDAARVRKLLAEIERAVDVSDLVRTFDALVRRTRPKRVGKSRRKKA
jgi:hypothetical protein